MGERPRVRMLTLEWYFSALSQADALRFVEIAAETWPVAIPTRFGPVEPMVHDFSKPEGRDKFVDLWKPEAWGFFWRATRPVFGGSVSWSPVRPVPRGFRREVKLEIHCDASGMQSDTGSAAAAVELLVRVADTFHAFFAAGYVTRGIVRTPQGAAVGEGTENFGRDWIAGPWWRGLPAKPTWLAWYGDSYASAMGLTLRELGARTAHGVLVQLGAVPLDSGEAAGRGPVVPAELVAPPLTLEQTFAMPIDERPTASLIPDLDTAPPSDFHQR